MEPLVDRMEKVVVSRQIQFVVIEVPHTQDLVPDLDLNLVRLDKLRLLLQADRCAARSAVTDSPADSPAQLSAEDCSAVKTALSAAAAVCNHDVFYEGTTWQPGSVMASVLQVPLVNKFGALSGDASLNESVPLLVDPSSSFSRSSHKPGIAAATAASTAAATTASTKAGKFASFGSTNAPGIDLLARTVDAVVTEDIALLAKTVDAVAAEAEASAVPAMLNAKTAKALLGGLTFEPETSSVYNSVSDVTDFGVPACLESLVNSADAEAASSGCLQSKDVAGRGGRGFSSEQWGPAAKTPPTDGHGSHYSDEVSVSGTGARPMRSKFVLNEAVGATIRHYVGEARLSIDQGERLRSQVVQAFANADLTDAAVIQQMGRSIAEFVRQLADDDVDDP